MDTFIGREKELKKLQRKETLLLPHTLTSIESIHNFRENFSIDSVSNLLDLEAS